MEFNATFLVSTISFILFVFLMNKIFYEPLTNMICYREKLVNETLNEADGLKRETDAILLDKENKLNKARQDSKSLIAKSIDEASKVSKEATSKAKENSIRKINSQKEDLAVQDQEMRQQLNDSINEISDKIIGKILG